MNIKKYKADLFSVMGKVESDLYFYEDLDNDGNSERIEYITKYNDRLGLMVAANEKLINQWDFSGVLIKTQTQLITDYDGDGIKEIFVFTVHNDSILLNCLDAFKGKIEIENKFICKVLKDNGVYDIKIYPCPVFDIDRDGYKEIFFSIVTGYAIHPRNMFAYYPIKDSVLKSPESCSMVFSPVMFDFDGDNKPEFIGSTMASGNCKPENKYSDL